MDIWLTIRILCLIGCSVALWMLATAHYRQWHSWNSKTKYHWFALAGWVFFGFYATAENIIQDLPGGSRSIVLALVVVFTIRALLRNEELRANPSVPWKGNKNQ